MPGKRRVLGMAVVIARMIGFALIVLAILSLPQFRFIANRLRRRLRRMLPLRCASPKHVRNATVSAGKIV